MRASRRLIAAWAVWEKMNANVNAWCRDCQQCARAKVLQQPAAVMQPIPVPSQCFSHMHLDIVGLLQTSASGWILTMIDWSTRWLEAIPLRSLEATICAEAFISSWVACFGVPARLTTDQSRKFTSAVWSCLCQLLGVEKITTTAYHPQSNGMIEGPHRQLKEALRASLGGHDWQENLP